MKNTSQPFVLCFAITVASAAVACQVPVFRYALERWPADDYAIVILHDGPLSKANQGTVRMLRESADGSAARGNFQVKTVEISGSNDPVLASVWANSTDVQKPLLVVLYPETAREVPDRLVSVGPLTSESAEKLVDSPVRQEIAKRLATGESAVWVFVPCGDADRDNVAMDTLAREIENNEKSLELPEQEVIESEEELLQQVDLELRLDFSIVTLRRDDPKEQSLLRMLLASEVDLESLDQPMAFPVLGRGRVLYALVGKGISDVTIGMASRFIIGPCSCQVKDQNPGFDLLMSYDWDDAIGRTMLSEPPTETTTAPVLLPIPPGN